MGGQGFAQQYGFKPGQFGSGRPAAPQAGSGVTVNIENATVREDADFARIGGEIGFQVAAYG